MRLRALDIDGFGFFDAASSGDLPAGLVVLFSEDEQRKAALLGFVRGLLFGMHNGNWPLAGAPAGSGGLVLEAGGGAYRLRRGADADHPCLLLPDGRAASAEEMRRLLGGTLNGSTRRVFDVALTQMRAFAAPAGSAAASPGAFWHIDADTGRAAAVAAELRAERDQLLGAPGARLDALLRQLADVEERLEAARRHDAEYPARLRREAELRNQVGRLSGELAAKRQVRERLLLLLELWPPWSECWEARRSHDVLEPIDDFPAEASSLVDASRELAAARLALRRAAHEHERAERQYGELPGAGNRHQILGEIEAVCAELPVYRSKLSTFATARARRDELQRLLPESARRVAGHGGETKFDPARLDLQEARRWHARAQELAERETATRAALETTRGSLRQLRAEQVKAVREGDPSSPTMNPLDRRWLSLWRLQLNLDELWEVQSQGEVKARLTEERAAELANHTRLRWRVPPRWLRVFLWALIGGAFAAALISVRAEHRTRTMLFGGLAFAGMLADLMLAARARLASARNAAAAADEERLRWDLEQARQARDARWRRAGELATTIQSEAAALGLSPTPDETQIEEYEEKLLRESAARAEVGVLTQVALGLHSKADEVEMMAAQLAEVREARAQVDADWEAWKLSVGLPEHLEQVELPTYLCEFDRWRELRHEAEKADTDLQRLAPEIGAWENRARAVLASAGTVVADSLCGRDLVEHLQVLRESARRSAQRQGRRRDLEAEIARCATAQRECEGRVARAARRVDQLAAAAGTTDQEEFERRRRVYDRRRQLRAQIERGEAAIDARLAALEEGERAALREQLAAGERGDWEAALREVDARLQSLEPELDGVSQRQLAAAAECRRMEESTDTVGLRRERAALLADIAELAGEWRRLALAQSLIETTLGELEGTRQSALLDAAAQILDSASEGRFTRIVRHNGSDVLSVIDRGGQQHAVPDEVEPGVAEQLFLSLHLVLARDHAHGDGAPPLLLDDVLRDLGEGEAHHMAAEVARLAAAHQVLFFTSHRPTLERLRALGDDTRVVEL